MTIKILSILALVSIASAGDYQEYSAPTLIKSYTPAVVKTVAAAPLYKQLDYQNEAPAAYDFSYAVHDDHTGDIKSQQESRKGNAVQGHYELIDSDGFRRIVEYTADEHTGFNAIVHREPTDIKIPYPAPQYQKVLAPVAKLGYAAPVTKVAYSSPVAYSAPAVTKLSYAAPITKVAYAAPLTKVAYSSPINKITYAAPTTKLVSPVGHYVSPVAHYAAAPVTHIAAAPVAHYAAPVAHHVDDGVHVTFSGPGSTYHY